MPDVLNQDFLSVEIPLPPGPTFSISGTISGSVQTGIVLVLNGAARAVVISEPDGSYTFPALNPGTYWITPFLSGFLFSPTSRKVEIVNANLSTENFTSAVSASAYWVRGTISGAVRAGVNIGIVMNNNSQQISSVVSDVNGNYYAAMSSTAWHTVTPTLEGFTFSPASALSGAGLQIVNFTASAV